MPKRENAAVDIGQKIYEIRKAEGLSQTEFAEKFHVTRQTVSNWEHGKNYPDMEILIKISDEYGITFDELIKSDKELIRSIDLSPAKKEYTGAGIMAGSTSSRCLSASFSAFIWSDIWQ